MPYGLEWKFRQSGMSRLDPYRAVTLDLLAASWAFDFRASGLIVAIAMLVIDLLVFHTGFISSSALLLVVLGTVAASLLPKDFRWFKVTTVFGLSF